VYASVEFQQLVGSGGSSWLLPMSRDSSVVAEQGLEPLGSQIRCLEPTYASSVKRVIAVVLGTSLLVAFADALRGGGIHRGLPVELFQHLN